MTIRDEFKVHMLNDAGRAKAEAIAEAYSRCLTDIEAIVTTYGALGNGGRELAIARTKLEESAFFAKRAMAQQACNQQSVIETIQEREAALDAAFTDLDALAMKIAAGDSDEEVHRIVAGEVCTRFGPDMVQRLDRYFTAAVERERAVADVPGTRGAGAVKPA